MTNTVQTDWFAPYFAAMEKLRKIPGVIRVGLGHKEQKDNVLPGYALRVYVECKKPANKVPSGEMIPATVDGIPTDVHTHFETSPEASFGTPSVESGRQLELYLNSPDQKLVWNSGTVCCAVTKGSERYLISNRHVLLDNDPLAANFEVYTPTYSDCGAVKCREKSGTVVLNSGHNSRPKADGDYILNGQKYFIDCALVLLTPEAKVNNNIPGKGDLKPDINDLTLLPRNPDNKTLVTPVKVFKLGVATGFTEGIVTEIYDGNTWELKIKALPGKGKEFPEVTYEFISEEVVDSMTETFINGTVHPTKIDATHAKFTGELFSNHGDSGSPVFDENMKLVGIIHGGIYPKPYIANGTQVEIPSGISSACHAKPVWAKLGLNEDNAIIQPGDGSAGAALDLPGTGTELDNAAYELSESDFYKTAEGREIIDSFHYHSSELVALVHHHRPVKVAWHRNHGPVWAAKLLDGLKKPGKPIIPEEQMDDASQDMDRFFTILHREASPGLRKMLDRHLPRLREMLSQYSTFDELIRQLNQAETNNV